MQKRALTRSSEDGELPVGNTIHCTLAEVAEAVNLRQEDASFAMHEVGMIVRTIHKEEPDGRVTEKLLLTRDLVEEICTIRDVKPPCLQLEFVHL